MQAILQALEDWPRSRWVALTVALWASVAAAPFASDALALALASGSRLEEAACLANLAAGIAVGKLGTATISVPELRRRL